MINDRSPLLHDIAVFVLAALLFAAGTTSQLWDRDEPRYAEASRQMLQTGDAIVPTFNWQPRYKKPPATYWLQAAAYAAFGVHEFAARLPAVLFSALTCLLIFRFVRRRTGRLRAAWLAVAAFALCPMTMIQSGAATTDAVLLALLTALLLGWLALTEAPPVPATVAASRLDYRQQARHSGRWLAWYALLAAALLVKFPVPLGVLGITGILYYGTDWHALRRLYRQVRSEILSHLSGIGVVILLVGLWVIAAQERTHGDFLRELIFNEVINRAAVEQEGHKGPLVYYLIVLPLLWLPWPLLLWLSWRRVPELLDRTATRWLVCIAAGTMLIFSVVSTKLPHYVYPAYPPLAMLVGCALDRALGRHAGSGPAIVRMRDGWGWWRQFARVSVSVICWITVVAGLLLPAAVLVMALDSLLLPAVACSLALIVAADRVACGMWGRHWPRIIGGATIGTLLFCGLARTFAVTAFDDYKPGRAIGAALQAAAPGAEGEDLHCFGYREDSLVFYTHCRKVDHNAAAWRELPFWEWFSETAAASETHRAFALIELLPDEHGAWPSVLDSATPVVHESHLRGRFTRLCRVGPFLHYNRGHNNRFMLELWICTR
ncbi:MAG: ArnT family glycosyltransferase [Planctomycetota bacterium]